MTIAALVVAAALAGAAAVWTVEHHNHLATLLALSVLIGPGWTAARLARSRHYWFGQGAGKRIKAKPTPEPAAIEAPALSSPTPEEATT